MAATNGLAALGTQSKEETLLGHLVQWSSIVQEGIAISNAYFSLDFSN